MHKKRVSKYLTTIGAGRAWEHGVNVADTGSRHGKLYIWKEKVVMNTTTTRGDGLGGWGHDVHAGSVTAQGAMRRAVQGEVGGKWNHHGGSLPSGPGVDYAQAGEW